MTEERRKSVRVRVALEARLTHHAATETTRTYDISAGGCSLEATGQAAPGERVELELRLPDGRWLSLSCEVVHTMLGAGLAVRFLDASAEQRQALAQLMEAARAI
ncbi:MAG TPA: PilZ domain-containing protein [Pyrinomonadaceae bacterium]|nr:PilZ domain-containing protein [Pyrinomonadaceae bacterium]